MLGDGLIVAETFEERRLEENGLNEERPEDSETRKTAGLEVNFEV